MKKRNTTKISVRAVQRTVLMHTRTVHTKCLCSCLKQMRLFSESCSSCRGQLCNSRKRQILYKFRMGWLTGARFVCLGEHAHAHTPFCVWGLLYTEEEGWRRGFFPGKIGSLLAQTWIKVPKLGMLCGSVCVCMQACQRSCSSPQAQTSEHWGFPVWCPSPQKQRERRKMTLLCMYKSPQLKWGQLGCRVVPTSS